MTGCRTLAEALRVERGDIVAFVGGGGKTGAILRLVDELRALEWRVLATTTTKVGRSIGAALEVVEAVGRRWRDRVAAEIGRSGSAFLAAGRTLDGKLGGIDPAELDSRVAGLADVVLVEADGARQMPIKAPAEHEPVIPGSTTLVVPMVGLDALGRGIRAAQVHRPELLRAVTGHRIVTTDAVVALMTSAEGSLKGVPATARVRPILNKVDAGASEAAARIAEGVLAGGPASLDRVVIADIATAAFTYLARPGG
jgi:probable selenium-dependent hydroxylase accessory protein YqeC